MIAGMKDRQVFLTLQQILMKKLDLLQVFKRGWLSHDKALHYQTLITTLIATPQTKRSNFKTIYFFDKWFWNPICITTEEDKLKIRSSRCQKGDQSSNK